MALRGVYTIIHLPSRSVYVGKSNDMVRRWQDHCRLLDTELHHCQKLQALWLTDGPEAFTFNILKRLHSQDAIDALEVSTIGDAEKINACLNVQHTDAGRDVDVLPDGWKHDPKYVSAYKELRNRERNAAPLEDIQARRAVRRDMREHLNEGQRHRLKTAKLEVSRLKSEAAKNKRKASGKGPIVPRPRAKTEWDAEAKRALATIMAEEEARLATKSARAK